MNETDILPPIDDSNIIKQIQNKIDKIPQINQLDGNRNGNRLPDLNHTMNMYIDNIQQIINEYKYYGTQMEIRNDGDEKKVATNDRKSFYESQQYDNLLVWNIRLRWVYNALAIMLILVLFLSKNAIGFYSKIGISVFLLLYPYIIYYLLLPIAYLYKFIYGLIPKNVYNSL
jgi:hypothetical protein